MADEVHLAGAEARTSGAKARSREHEGLTRDELEELRCDRLERLLVAFGSAVAPASPHIIDMPAMVAAMVDSRMSRCWTWKDDLPARGLACVGKHLGRGLITMRNSRGF